MAKSLRAPAPAVHPTHVYQSAIAAGIDAACAWFAHPTDTAAGYRHTARAAYVGQVIDQSPNGSIPFAAAVEGFTEGFAKGLAQAIAGGASHV